MSWPINYSPLSVNRNSILQGLSSATTGEPSAPDIVPVAVDPATGAILFENNSSINTSGSVQTSTSSTTSNNLLTSGAATAAIVLNVSAASGGTVTLTINAVTSSGFIYNILTSVAVSTVGTTPYRIGVGLNSTPNLVANDLVPSKLQVVATVSGAITYAIDYELGA